MTMEKLRFTEIPDAFRDILKSLYYPTFVSDFIEVEGCFMPKYFKDYSYKVLDFKVRDDDIFVCSFPKCGTTWTQEMVWCIGNDLDYERAKTIPIQERFPYIEICGMGDFTQFGRPEYTCKSLEFAENLQGQRFLKSHMPLHLLPRQLQSAQSKAKVVYVARDPRDACVSFYHHHKLLRRYTGDFDSFFNLFINDKVIYAPFWKHVMDFWSIRKQPNILFITYEEMKKDLPSVIQRVATFLGKTLSFEQVNGLSEHLSFNNMKNNPSVNYENVIASLASDAEGEFMRSGKSGSFLKEMTPTQIELINEWSKKHLEGTDYPHYN